MPKTYVKPLLLSAAKPLTQKTKQNKIIFFDYCNAYKKYFLLAHVAPLLYPYKLICVDQETSPSSKLAEMENLTRILAPAEIFSPTLAAAPPSCGENEIECQEPDLIALYHLQLSSKKKLKIEKSLVAEMLAKALNFSRYMLRAHDPIYVIIWNMFHPLSQIAAKAAKEFNKTILWAEYGVFPNTLAFDARGQCGCSSLALTTCNEPDMELTGSRLEKVLAWLELLRDNSLENRHPEDKFGQLKEAVLRKAGARPIIFYAGYNDLASGTFPYTENSRIYHSPIFKDSDQCAEYLLGLCRKNNWLLLYKPHPHYQPTKLNPDDPHLFLSEKGHVGECIEISDLVTTVLSQTSYLALIRKKAVLMLGYNELKNKAIVWQAESLEEVEKLLREAMAHGFTDEQKRNWLGHCAHWLENEKLFLLNQNDVGVGFVKDAPACAQYLKHLARFLGRL